MSEFIPLDEVEWKTVRYLERPDETFEFELILPRPLADWDVFGCWERARVHSMRDHLQPGMTLFDVGTEQGWLTVVYASLVGPENMILIEPTPEFWPNIKATWLKNFEHWPQCCYDGLISDKTTDARDDFYDWPTASDGPLIDRNRYQYIHDNNGNIPEMRLDDLQENSGAIPDALTIDVEGAELLVLQGARRTLETYRPLVWCSVHPDLMARDYDCCPEELFFYMQDLGYNVEFLAEDHEKHYLFEPQ